MDTPDVTQLSDKALLDFYGKAKTGLMFGSLFNLDSPQDLMDLVRRISAEISVRKLDQGPEHVA